MKTENKMERLTMTVEEAGEALGISRATAYLLAKTGDIPVIRLGERRLVVPIKALDELLASAGKAKD
ncbi:MAG: helix-turn-helix domain-containing protein [Dehalococcoidia bacterium]